MVRVNLTGTSVQKSDTKSDLTDEYVESIETTEDPQGSGSFKKPPIPRPRTSKAKEAAESVDMDKISSISEQYDISNLTMKSETKSYKENIKTRFKQIKSNSSKSLLKAKRKGVKVKNRKLSDTISFGLLREESRLVEDKLRNKERYCVESSVENSRKLAFFCEVKQYDGDSGEIPSTIDPGQNSVVFSKAEDLSSLVEIARNENITILNGFTSSLAKTEALSKLNQDGIYRPDPPNSRKFDINLLEKRLMESEIKDWFGSDGQLRFLDNPRRCQKLKPALSSKNVAKTIYTLPTLDSSLPEEIVVTGKNTMIDLHFKSIRFSHHPLFSAEHVLQEMLLYYYDIYREFVVSNKQERMSRKLDTLRTKVGHFSEDCSGDLKPTLDNIKTAITNLRENLFLESKKYRDNMKNILATWKNIKKRVQERTGKI